MDNTTEKNSISTEAKFIEQEHRFLLIVKNFIERTQWERNDKRRIASKHALIWSIVSPSGAAVFGGATIGFFTLLILGWQGIEISKQSKFLSEQNSIISDQNKYLQEQNKKIQQQLYEEKERFLVTRHTELLKILFDEKNGEPTSNAKLRANALFEYLALFPDKSSQLSGALLQKTDLSKTDLSGLNLQKIDFSFSVLEGTNFSFSNLMGAKFNNAIINNTNFTNSNLQNVNYDKASITKTIFKNANMYRASFIETRVWESGFINLIGFPNTFKNADCIDCKFSVKKGTNSTFPIGDTWLLNVLVHAHSLYKSEFTVKIKNTLLKYNSEIFMDKRPRPTIKIVNKNTP